MKRLLFALCITSLLIPSLHAQDPTAEELNKAIQYLEKTRDNLVAATKGLSDAQLNFKPAPDRWSVAQVVEHLAASETMLFDLVRDKVMKSPGRTNAVDLKELDAFVLERVPDRSNKAQAPEPLQPNNRFGSPADSLKHFEEARAKTIAFLKTTKDLRGHAMEAPVGKTFDAYQWLLFIGAHSERHTKQLLEVKAAPNFPK